MAKAANAPHIVAMVNDAATPRACLFRVILFSPKQLP
jgi:hypothetical protein